MVVPTSNLIDSNNGENDTKHIVSNSLSKNLVLDSLDDDDDEIMIYIHSIQSASFHHNTFLERKRVSVFGRGRA